MRVLLDECLPRRLKRDLVGHDARTAPEMGWASRRNSELLRLAEREFDAFLTVDRKLQHQEKLSGFRIAVIVLVAGDMPNVTSLRGRRWRQGDMFSWSRRLITLNQPIPSCLEWDSGLENGIERQS